jgi:hypothetical protein
VAEQSISITFVTKEVAAGKALVVDLDAEKNEDKSQFLYGEKAYFRIFTYPENMKIAIIESDGNITTEGNGLFEEEENIVFANVSEASCSKPISSIKSSKWLGESLGAIAVEGNKIKASSKGVAILKLKYTASFRRYGLQLGGRSDDSYTVLVYIHEVEED